MEKLTPAQILGRAGGLARAARLSTRRIQEIALKASKAAAKARKRKKRKDGAA